MHYHYVPKIGKCKERSLLDLHCGRQTWKEVDTLVLKECWGENTPECVFLSYSSHTFRVFSSEKVIKGHTPAL